MGLWGDAVDRALAVETAAQAQLGGVLKASQLLIFLEKRERCDEDTAKGLLLDIEAALEQSQRNRHWSLQFGKSSTAWSTALLTATEHATRHDVGSNRVVSATALAVPDAPDKAIEADAAADSTPLDPEARYRAAASELHAVAAPSDAPPARGSMQRSPQDASSSKTRTIEKNRGGADGVHHETGEG